MNIGIDDMRVEYPNDARVLLKEKLVLLRDRLQPYNPLAPLHTLLIVPSLASDEEVKHILVNLLATGYPAERRDAAEILQKIGDPRGILHLTYNSLSLNPYTGTSQQHGETRALAKKRLFPYVTDMTDECIDLVVTDLSTPLANFHIDILAAVSEDKIVPRMLPLLDDHSMVRAYAAYILAMKGRAEGREILENLAESGKHVELALIALSHIADDKTLAFLRAYAKPDHPIYQQHQNLVLWLRPLAEQRLFLLECQDRSPLVRTMERFFRKGIAQISRDSLYDPNQTPDLTLPKNCGIEFFVVGNRWGRDDISGLGSAVDFISEFSSQTEREQCAAIQREALRNLLKLEGVNLGDGRIFRINNRFMLGLPYIPAQAGSFYDPPLTITLEEGDHEHAATDWILHPEKYRVGSYEGGPYANYEGAAEITNQKTKRRKLLPWLFG